MAYIDDLKRSVELAPQLAAQRAREAVEADRKEYALDLSNDLLVLLKADGFDSVKYHYKKTSRYTFRIIFKLRW